MNRREDMLLNTFRAVLLSALVASSSVAVVAADCNQNGIDDAEEIRAGAPDCNENAVPDDCEVAPLEFGLQAENLSLSTTPNAIAAGDLDGDGHLDLVSGNVATDRSSNLSVFLGGQEGMYEEEVVYQAAERLSDVVLTDLDSDGALDVASVNSTVVQLFMNRGDGMLEAPTDVPVERSTRLATALDLGADGDADLVTSNASLDTMQLLENAPTGMVRVVATLATIGERPTEMTTADFDGDGLEDLAITNVDTQAVQPFFQTPAGGFRGGVALSTGRRLSAVAAEDFDRDGRPDLAALRPDGLEVWFGDGVGGFSEPTALAASGFALEAVDANGDGVPDLLSGTSDRKSIEVHVSRGDGTFAIPQRFSTDYVALTTGDFTGDGRVDVALSNKEPDRISILRAGASAALSLDGDTFPVRGRPHGITTADFDGNGTLDVITSNGDDSTYARLEGLGNGQLGPSTVVPIENTHANSVGAADFDRDGDVDIVIGGPRGDLIVFLNEGDGTLTEQSKRFGTVGSVRFLVVSDMDRDGAADLVIPSIGGLLGVYFNNGAASFEEEHVTEINSVSASTTVADFDGNGFPDVATALNSASEIAIIPQLSARQLGALTALPIAGGTTAVIALELNRDGAADLAVANTSPSGISTLVNRGDGTFENARFIPSERQPTAIDAFDVQGDGLDDVLTISEPTDSLSFFAGRGDGTLASPQHLSVGNGPRIFTHADMDGDGDQDILVANRMATTVSLLLNRQGDGASQLDHLERICTELDFHRLSVRLDGGGSQRRALDYLATAVEGTDLPPLVFQNTRRHPSPLEFLRDVFPERYANITAQEFTARVEKRSSRELYAGSVHQLQLQSEGLVFGFSVTVDETVPDELLTQEEVALLHEQLREGFQLEPFGYVPLSRREREAVAEWSEPGFPVFLLPEEPTEPEPEGPPPPAPTFELVLPEGGHVLCGVFQDAGAGRAIRDEYDLKSQLSLRGGSVELPTTADQFEAPLFDSVWLGPDETPLEPATPGTFTLRRIPASAQETVYRFTYAQTFTHPDGQSLDIRWVAPIEFRSTSPTTRLELSDDDFITRPPSTLIQATTQDGRRVHFGSCSNASLPLVRVDVALEDDTTLTLEERFREEDTDLDTAAASLVRAHVATAGESRTVVSYVDLVYSAFRHNRAVTYWVVLEEPLAPPDVAAPVAVLEILAPETEPSLARPASAQYLDGNFEVLKTLAVTSFERSRAPEAATFRRGDVSGDGRLDITDTIALLSHLFQRTPPPRCRVAADANDDGRLNIVDVVRIVSVVFGRLEALPAPYPDCGEDPTADDLGCAIGCADA